MGEIVTSGSPLQQGGSLAKKQEGNKIPKATQNLTPKAKDPSLSIEQVLETRVNENILYGIYERRDIDGEDARIRLFLKNKCAII